MRLPDSRNARSRNLSFVAVKSYLLRLFLCKNGKSNLQWLLFNLFGKKSITCGSWKWSNKRLLRPRHKNLSQISGGRERMKAPKNRLMAASRNGKKTKAWRFCCCWWWSSFAKRLQWWHNGKLCYHIIKWFNVILSQLLPLAYVLNVALLSWHLR